MYAQRGISITQAAVSLAISTGRIKGVDTNRNTGGVPWLLKSEHRHRHAARMLRTQSRLDDGMEGPTLLGQVNTWRKGLEMEDTVIHYDPDTEEGFWRVPRCHGIDEWWFRDPTKDDNGATIHPRR